MEVTDEFVQPEMLRRFALYTARSIHAQAQYPTIHTMAVLILESKSPDYARRAAWGTQSDSPCDGEISRGLPLVAKKGHKKHAVLFLNEGFFVSRAFEAETSRLQPMRVLALTDAPELSKYVSFEVSESPAWNIAIVQKVRFNVLYLFACLSYIPLLLLYYVQDQKPNCKVSHMWAYNMGTNKIGRFAVTIQTLADIKKVETPLIPLTHSTIQNSLHLIGQNLHQSMTEHIAYDALYTSGYKLFAG